MRETHSVLASYAQVTVQQTNIYVYPRLSPGGLEEESSLEGKLALWFGRTPLVHTWQVLASSCMYGMDAASLHPASPAIPA